MNLEETQYWYGQIFPNAVVPSPHTPRVYRASDNAWGDGTPVQLSSWELFTAANAASASTATSAANAAMPPQPEVCVATADLSRVDCGLRTPAQQDVRVELVMLGRADAPLRDIVATAADMVATNPAVNYPQPGRVLKNAVSHAVYALLLADDEVRGRHGARNIYTQETTQTPAGSTNSASSTPAAPNTPDAPVVSPEITGVTTPHLLCVVPSMWSQGAPQVVEAPGQVSYGQGDSVSPGGRITTMTQLLPITDAELEFLAGVGLDTASISQQGMYPMAAQELLSRLYGSGIDVHDLARDSVALGQ